MMLLKVKVINHPQIKMCFLDLIVEEHENEIEILHSQIQSYDFHDPKEFLQNLPSPSHEEIVLPFDFQIEDNHAFKEKTEELGARIVTEDFSVSSPEIVPHIYVRTPPKISLHPHAVVSPTSSSTSQSTFSTPPSTTHTPTIISTLLVVPFLPTLPFIPVNMDQKGPEETIPHDAFVDPIADYMELLLNSKSLTCCLYEDQVYQQWPFYVTILIMGAHDRIMPPISLVISQAVHFFLHLLKWLHWMFHFT